MKASNEIKQRVQSDEVVLFMKGRPGNSACGYSNRMIQILNHVGVKFVSYDVLISEELRNAVKLYSGIKTLPQLFLKGNFVGGTDDIRTMYEQQELEKYFKERGVATFFDLSAGPLVIDDIERDELISCAKAS